MIKQKLFFWIILLFLLSLFWKTLAYECNHIIPVNGEYYIDWKINWKLVLPWEIVCIEAGKKNKLMLKDFKGELWKPIIFTNYWWQVFIDSTYSYWLVFHWWEYIHLDWKGDSNNLYWIKVKTTNAWAAVSFDLKSTEIEVNNIEVFDTNSAWIKAKTDPTCDNGVDRDSWEMNNVYIHNNYLHNIGTEWFYIGSSFYKSGQYFSSCDKTFFPHIIKWVRIENNIVDTTWWDWIQVSSSQKWIWKDCIIKWNVIKNDSQLNNSSQMSWIIVWWGSDCDVKDNKIENWKWPSILFFWYNWIIDNNFIINSWLTNPQIDWILIDDRSWLWDFWEIYVTNNSIINSWRNWIRFYNPVTLKWEIHNNFIVNPWNLYTAPQNHWSLKEPWSYVFLELNRIDRSRINWGTPITNWVNYVFDLSDNVWLVEWEANKIQSLKDSNIQWALKANELNNIFILYCVYDKSNIRLKNLVSTKIQGYVKKIETIYSDPIKRNLSLQYLINRLQPYLENKDIAEVRKTIIRMSICELSKNITIVD